jgi:precorrin-6B methylase 2
MPFIYALAVHQPEMSLAHAELHALTGVRGEGRVVLSDSACDITRSVYVEACGELLAQAPSLQDLCDQIRATGLGADGFRVDVRRIMGSGNAADSPDVACQVATVLRGNPDLEHPRVRFLALSDAGTWRLARVLSQTNRGYHLQDGRPRNFSFSLAVHHARALVNLVAAPGDRLLDPCCGVGTCVVEALHMGIRAHGLDLNRHAVRMARTNLEHFGLPACIETGDARTAEGSYDAAVIDLPYGRTSHPEPGLYREILNNVADRVLRMAVVTAEPADELAAELGLRVLARATVAKGAFARHYTVMTRRLGDAGAGR